MHLNHMSQIRVLRIGLSNKCLSGRFLAYSRSHPTATGIAAGDISNPPDRHRGQLACVVQNREREGGGVSDLEQGDTTNERAPRGRRGCRCVTTYEKAVSALVCNELEIQRFISKGTYTGE